MKKKYLCYLPKSLSIVFLVLLTISCGNEEKPKVNKTIKVKVMNVGLHTNNSQGKVAYSGTIEADVVIKSSFQVSGNVLHVPVSIGDFVKKNQLIAQIDATIYSSQYEQQLAQVRLAKENYERINNVFQKGSIAEIRMLEARSQYEQAQAAAKMTYENVRHAKLYAPMDGYVSDKMMDVGDLAQPGQPVVELVNIKTVKAVLPIPDSEINTISKGDTASVVIPSLGDMDISGVVDEISIQSNQGSPVYTAYVKLNNAEKKIKPGMTCTVSFVNNDSGNAKEEQTIIIPSESIAVTEDDKRFVYVVNGNSADRRYVETGRLYDGGIAITKGLKKGDQLIVSGYHKLTQSTQVEIINDSK